MRQNKKIHGYSDSDLFKDEEEKQKILGLKDVEKEMIIYDKLNILDQKKEREKLLGEKHTKNIEPPKKKGRTELSPSNSDSQELGEIVTKEEKTRKRRKESNSSNDDHTSSLDSSEKEIEKPKKEKVLSITLEEIEKVKLTRNFFSQYNNVPIFQENVKNAFIRVNLRSTGKQTSSSSSGYIIGTIKEVFTEPDKPYTFMGSKCNKYVRLKHAAIDRDFDFKVISNSNIQEEELNLWLEHLEKDNQTPPSGTELAEIQKKIEEIVKYNLTEEELSKILNEKKSDRIKYKDSTINITELLDLAKERYNLAKDDYKAKKEKKYFDIMNETEKEIKTLEKMKEERDRREKLRSENDIVVKINEETIKRQKMDDLKNNLLQKKRINEIDNFEHIVFKRVDCHPSNLFETSSNEKEKENEDKQKKIKEENERKNNNENNVKPKLVVKKKQEKNTNYILTQKLKKFKTFIEDKKDIIDEMMEYEKLKNDNEKEKKDSNNINDKIDMSFFFNLANINYKTFYKNINDENKKNTLDPKVKIIKLEDLYGNKNNSE